MGLLVIWSIFGYYIFFSGRTVFSSLGLPYPNLTIYWIITAGICLTVLVWKFIRKKERVYYRQWALLLIGIFAAVLLQAAHNAEGQNYALMRNAYRYYLFHGIPSLFLGVILYKRIMIDDIEKWLDAVILLFFIALTVEYIKSGGGKTGISLGGSSYQNYSYCAAYVIALDLYMVIYSRRTQLFPVFRSMYYNIVRTLLMPVLFIYLIAGGGRGALVFVCIAVLAVAFEKIILKKQIVQMIAILAVAGVVLAITMPIIQNNENLNNRFERATAFIDDSGNIDIENGSSGRKLVYDKATTYIKQKPVLGYGLMGSIRETGSYCHNMYLDILFEGGVVYLAFWIIITFLLAGRIIWIVKKERRNMIHCLLFLCIYVMLMFSGYYFMQGGLWFYLGYFLSIKKKR